MDSEPEHLTIDEAAAMLRVDPYTVKRYIKRGVIAAAKLHDGPKAPVRIPRSEIGRLLTPIRHTV